MTDETGRQTPARKVRSRSSRKRHWWRWILASVGVLVVLVVIQIALGYQLRDGSGEAGAWHVPNGVLIFGLSVFIHTQLPRLKAAARGV